MKPNKRSSLDYILIVLSFRLGCLSFIFPTPKLSFLSSSHQCRDKAVGYDLDAHYCTHQNQSRATCVSTKSVVSKLFTTVRKPSAYKHLSEIVKWSHFSFAP